MFRNYWDRRWLSVFGIRQASRSQFDTRVEGLPRSVYSNQPINQLLFQAHSHSLQDRYAVRETDQGSLYAVFDGHGGGMVSETAKNTFADHFFALLGEGSLRESWFNTFQATEESYRALDLKEETGGSKRLEGREGSTCNAAFIRGNKLSTANAGDSRCVLCQKNGSAIAMSTDHKPTDAAEYIRLQENGFKVVRGRIYRIDTGKGGLNLSRALGDFHYENGVPFTPDVYFKTLTEEDELLILGTDGLWDAMTNQEACKVARRQKNMDRAAAELTRVALMNGSSDNITAIVVQL